ncbi:GNAT family N-acetyltransferase [Lacisediminihabitans profunda]|uniref:N-acetyltransferase n=1 Tax=Lacisediminihabitans profunda TaxID=2594790 RepID=A0A5C8UN77_9MICO|nr:GNAT family N-acetyltransferase [Lacisediminihabitans profunda]TXN29683.1 N-acetyltransferase [Lacisediminihabitans profunda]
MKTIEDVGGRYELAIDGAAVAVSTYRDVGQRRVFLHTEVDPDHAGQGLATELIEWALGDVREKGLRIVARCPMVAGYLTKHHQFDDLVDSPQGVDGP